MPLRIALDTRRVADFGIGTYIRNLVRALARVDDRNQYQLITTERPVPEFSDLPPNFETAIFPGDPGSRGPRQAAWRRFAMDCSCESWRPTFSISR